MRILKKVMPVAVWLLVAMFCVSAPAESTAPAGIDERGGVYVVFNAEQGSYSDEEFSSLLIETLNVLTIRLNQAGYAGAKVTLSDGNCICAELPELTDAQIAVDLLGTAGHITFVDPNGNVMLENCDFAAAKAVYDPYSAAYVVSFKLTDEGTALYVEATRKWKGSTITVMLDDEVISSPRIKEHITDGSGEVEFGAALSFSESQTASKLFSAIIISGPLPVELEVKETDAISAGDISAESNVSSSSTVNIQSNR